MDYANSVQTVLLRKIQKAEQDLVQLKLDYCRFIFGLSHRTRVTSGGRTYQVRSVDVESMQRLEDGNFSRPEVSAVPADSTADDPVSLGTDWHVESARAVKGAG